MPCIVRDTTPPPGSCCLQPNVGVSRNGTGGPPHCQRTRDATYGRRHRASGRLRDTPDVRITGIRLDRLVLPLDPPFPAAWDPVPRRSFAATIVRIETDEGVVGIGSGDTMDGFEAFEHLFIGGDPLAIAHHVRVLETIDFHAGRYWPLEVALWDIIGQVAGLPVATLFGGATTGIPAYASCGMLLAPAARAESALRLRDEGFSGAQDPGRSPTARGRPRHRGGDPARGRRFDGDHGRPQPGLADGRRHDAVDRPGRRLGRSRSSSPSTTSCGSRSRSPARTCAAWPRSGRRGPGVRIAGGEMTRTFSELLAAVEADAFDVHQPDVVLAAGMLRGRAIAELAHARNRWYTPHTWSNGIGLLANLHVAAGVGGGPFIEFPYDPPGWTPERRDFMLAEPTRPGPDGILRVPAAPGLGIVLDEAAVKRFAA